MMSAICDFHKLAAATPTLTGAQRMRLFDALRPALQGDCWQRLAEKLEGERVLGGVLTIDRRRRRTAREPSRSRSPRRPASRVVDDALLQLDPPDYVEALTGEPVINGRATCPWHDDHNPSLVVYPTADRGVYCFACNRGGSIYDFAGQVSGLGTRGEDFKLLRRWTAERLLGSAVAA